MNKNIRLLVLTAAVATTYVAKAQNQLFIPPALTGTTFDLNVQSDTTQFFAGINTPTFGVNGPVLAPTLILNKGDVVTLNVTNNLIPTTSTTMHWHGLHVAPSDDGGPNVVIFPGDTWSPQFTVLNNAATFWYHPHGEGKTDLQVSKGLAGLIIVKDPVEGALTLPRTYGVDDFPIIVQTKAFDILHQIAIATEMDTAVFVNATNDAFVEAPAQVVRLRLLNGASLRSFYFGFSNNMVFHQIATDGGLVEQPVLTNRLRLSPGERAEVLVNLTGMQGQSVYLMSYASELDTGIYGALQVGIGAAEIPGYDLNPLNGADFNLLRIDVVAQTATPVTTVPTSMTTITPWTASQATMTRTLTFDPIDSLDETMVEGPFTINGHQFDMDTVNIVTYLNTVEIWKLVNNTDIAHPFHIHDIQFNVLSMGFGPVPPSQQGWKDVVLVMPQDTVSFITKFETFTDDNLAYMFHCHMLHHEDDGMMGMFLVRDSSVLGVNDVATSNVNLQLYPNPADDKLFVRLKNVSSAVQWFNVLDVNGRVVIKQVATAQNEQHIDISGLPNGVYVLEPSACYQSFPAQRFVVHGTR